MLEKYSLHQIEEKQPRKRDFLHKRKIIAKKRCKLEKRRAIKDQNRAVIRKLKDIIKKYVSCEEAGEFSIRIGKKMEELYGKYSVGYRKGFRCMVVWLNVRIR